MNNEILEKIYQKYDHSEYIGVFHKDIVDVTLSKTSIELVLYHVQKKQETVGAGGAWFTAQSTQHKGKLERQITGYVGEMAIYQYWYGYHTGLEKFHQYREWYNEHPSFNDQGRDFLNFDIKTRRLIRFGKRANFHKSPINKNILNYELIIRPEFKPTEEHVYVLAVTEYSDNLLHNLAEPVVVSLLGYGGIQDGIWYPDGQTTIKGAHWAIPTTKMKPVENLINQNRFNHQAVNIAEKNHFE